MFLCALCGSNFKQMKNKIVYFTIAGLLLGYLNSHSQTSLNNYLIAVKSNNKALKTAQSYAYAQKMDAKTGIAPNDPEFEFGYFPGSTDALGTKKTIAFSQSIDFPSTYLHKNRISGKTQQLADIEFRKVEQHILLDAKKVWCNAI